MLKKQKKAFTMTELIVAITIVVILSAIWFVAYSDYISSARDSQRKVDFANIESALKSYKNDRWVYPEPGNTFKITYGTHTLAKQWKLNKWVILDKLDKLPTDPKKKIYYSYSVTRNNLEYQIAASLENDDNPIALLSGDYKTVAKNVLPTIMLAKEAVDVDISSEKDSFIYNKLWSLPYRLKLSWPLNKNITITNWEKEIWQNSSFMSCQEIKEAWKALCEWCWAINYQIVSWTGYVDTSCTF